MRSLLLLMRYHFGGQLFAVTWSAGDHVASVDAVHVERVQPSAWAPESARSWSSVPAFPSFTSLAKSNAPERVTTSRMVPRASVRATQATSSPPAEPPTRDTWGGPAS